MRTNPASARRTIVLAIVAVLTAATGLVSTAAPTAHGWRLRHCAAPAESAPAQVAYDRASAQIVAMLPTGTLISKDGKCWNRPATKDAPGRTSASLVYDPGMRRVLMFGGIGGSPSTYLGDTWLWDGKAWTERTGTGPSPRSQGAAVYDAATAQIVLFGGVGPSTATGTAIGNEILGDTWIWNAQRQTWSQGPSGPPARFAASMVYDAATRQVVLVGGAGTGNSLLSDTWTWDGHKWTHRLGSELPARAFASITYDAATRDVVLFGGQDNSFGGSTTRYLADTWTWNGSRWRQAGAGPAPRSGASFAYDEPSRHAVLFGGANINQTFDDTWIWAGRHWRRYTGPGPSARTNGTLVYADATRRLVLFSGTGGAYPGNVIGLRDAWTWNGRGWTLETGPLISQYFRGVYDDAAHMMVLHGPSLTNETGDDTYMWDGSRWSHLSGVEPPLRINPNMVYDAARHVVLLFGGFSIGSSQDGYHRRYLNDTWTFDGRQWRQHQGTAPPGRVRASLVYDAATKQVVLFGGTNFDNKLPSEGGTLGDTWTWDGSQWKQRTGTQPSARVGQSAVYDAAHHAVVVFGGYGPPSPAPEVGEGGYANDDVYLDDTWSWDGHAWHQSTATGPTPRREATVVYDPVSRRVVLVGGVGPANTVTQAAPFGVEDSEITPDPGTCGCFDPATFLGDAWSWDGSHWTQQSGSPTARGYATAAYDAATRQLLLFGGAAAGGYGKTGPSTGTGLDSRTPLGDTWNWSGKGWSKLKTSTAPSARWSGIMAYSPAGHQLILIGGLNNSGNVLGDTWTWS